MLIINLLRYQLDLTRPGTSPRIAASRRIIAAQSKLSIHAVGTPCYLAATTLAHRTGVPWKLLQRNLRIPLLVITGRRTAYDLPSVERACGVLSDLLGALASRAIIDFLAMTLYPLSLSTGS